MAIDAVHIAELSPGYWSPASLPPAPSGAPPAVLPSLTRNWTLFVLPHSHTDVGFTHPQPECIERQAANIDASLLFVEETQDWPEETRFKWNVEAALQLEHYARTRPARQVDRLVKACRAGSVGIEALWGNVLTGLCHTEELCRLTATAGAWRQRYGLTVDTAMFSDVAGYVWNLPQVLVRSGVRFLSCALNNHRAPLFTLGALPPLFYWEGPDGSRLLTWASDSYSYARLFGFAPVVADGTGRFPATTDEAVQRVADKLFPLLAHLEATGYPYDSLLLRGALGDNREADLQLAATARTFNATHKNPAIRLALSREFADHASTAIAERRWPTPPVLRGDWTGYWEDGAGSSARETGLNRTSQRRLFAVEAQHTLAALANPHHPLPGAAIDEALRYIWLYDEHTWGASGSVREPDSLKTRWQWRFKSDYAHQAADLVARLAREAPPLPAPANAAPAPPAAFTAGAKPASPVPPVTTIAVTSEWNGSVAENSRYRMEIDLHTGEVQHLLDKRLARDLCDQSSSYRLNQYWYEHARPLGGLTQVPRGAGWLGWLAGHLAFPTLPPKDAEQAPAAPARWRLVRRDGDDVEVAVERSAPGCAQLVQRVRLCGDAGVECVNELDKRDVREKEAVYFTFPFGVDAPSFRLEVGGVPLQPETDQLPGACRDWYAVQRYAAVGNNAFTVLWAPVEAPLVCVGGLTPERWRAHHPRPWPNGMLVSWALNNYWDVNYKASQGGPLVFRYRLGAHEGAFDPGQAVRWLARWPLPARDTVPGASDGSDGAPASLLAALGGAVSLDPDHVELLAVRRATQDHLVVRLVELAGRAARATLRLPISIQAAWRGTLTGEVLAPLPVQNDFGRGSGIDGSAGSTSSVEIDCEPHEIITVLLKTHRPPE